MAVQKSGFPEESSLVLCTVTSVQHHSIFVRIEDYGINGMIHISEIAPGRIRNIRDYVIEGKQVVCKVLRVDPSAGHVDLSLRRVTESQRRGKANEIKKEKLSGKILEAVAHNANMKPDEVYRAVSAPVLERFDSLFDCFSEIVNGNFSISELKLPKGISKELESVILDRLKPLVVVSKGMLNILSYASDGVEVVKGSLKRAADLGAEVSYLGGGRYSMAFKSDTYKKAEASLEKAADAAVSYAKSNGGIGEFAKKGK